MIRRNLLIDACLSKYIFHVLSTLRDDQKSELSEIELRILGNEKTIKRFADNATLEQKYSLLQKVGIEFQMFFKKRDADISFLKDVDYQYRDVNKRLDIVKKMEEGHVFLFGSKEVMFTLQLANTNAHNKAFLPDNRFEEIVKNAKFRGRPSVVDQASEVMASYDDLSKVASCAFIMNDKAPFYLGVKEHHLKIMSVLFAHRTRFTSREKLMQMLEAKESDKGFATICGDMIKLGLLMQPISADRNKKEQNTYMLTERGLEIMMKYLKWLNGEMQKISH